MIEPVVPDSYDPVPDSYDPGRDPFEAQLEPMPLRRLDARIDLPGHALGSPAAVTATAPTGPAGSLRPRDAGSEAATSPPVSGATRSPGSSSTRPRSEASGPDRSLRIGPRHDTREGGLFRRRATQSSPAPVPAGRRRAAFGAVTEVVVVLVMALVLSFVIKTFLVQAFFIPSESMYTTLLKGDRVLVSKLTPGPFSLHHGDVVVFKDPGGWLPAESPAPDSPVRGAVRQTLTFIGLLPTDSGEHLIKRVIGLPGDTVACCDGGKVTVNGVAIDETAYLNAGDQPSTLTFKVTVPANSLWVMGDHRSVSEDSRRHQELRGGFVPIGDVVGRAFVIVWPFEHVGGVSVPDAVFARVPDPPAPR